MTNIPAIPTRYAGVQFRSRLEARWAAFFDLVGWRWDYEPIDLAGYIPDFILASFREPVLVEVKPLHWHPSEVEGSFFGAVFTDAVDKIASSTWPHRAVVVGGALKGPSIVDKTLLYRVIGRAASSPSELVAPWRCWSCDEVSLRWGRLCLRCGFVPGRDTRRPAGTAQLDTEAAWREAGNRVQYQPPEAPG